MWSQERGLSHGAIHPPTQKDFRKEAAGEGLEQRPTHSWGSGESRPCEQWEDRRCAFLPTRSSHPAHGLVTRKKYPSVDEGRY